jgi:hypothetical protein
VICLYQTHVYILMRKPRVSPLSFKELRGRAAKYHGE